MCDFCENITNEVDGDLSYRHNGLALVRDKDNNPCIVQEFANDYGEMACLVSEPIRFCPMCGRKLSEEEPLPFSDEQHEEVPVKINLDDIIKVKLTPYGTEVYYHQYDETNKMAGRTVIEPHMPEIDKDGYTKFQLHHFVNLYGEHIRMCNKNVIEPLDIILCD